jgi:hypothetical protein
VGVAHVREAATTRRGTPDSATAGLEAEQTAAAVASTSSASDAIDSSAGREEPEG